jgi:oxygen-independent coproporphyrinogen-3 oxidase
MATLTPLTFPSQRTGPVRFDLRSVPAEQIDGIYVHIPFCAHKCHYCDFYSITRQTGDRMSRFVDRILAETDLWIEQLPATPRPTTVFFGGGTPTLLPVDQMDRLLTGLRARLDLSAVTEWTIEANPATVTAEYCRVLKSHGVNRLSFGAQSFNAHELAVLERHHDPADVRRSVEIACGEGFERLNVDLIYAIPDQSLDSWAKSLDTAVSLGTTHISCYALTYEPNTPMAVKKRLGAIVAAEESLEVQMMMYTRRTLAQVGLRAYEISNYARPGEECRHNLMYWTGGNYMALGPSGSSHVGGVRWKNRPHLGEWEQAVDAGDLPATDVEKLSPAVRQGELAMLMLRLAEGLNFNVFAARTGVEVQHVFGRVIDRYVSTGLLEHTPTTVRVTERGLVVADALASEFLTAAQPRPI